MARRAKERGENVEKEKTERPPKKKVGRRMSFPPPVHSRLTRNLDQYHFLVPTSLRLPDPLHPRDHPSIHLRVFHVSRVLLRFVSNHPLRSPACVLKPMPLPQNRLLDSSLQHLSSY